MIYPFEFAYDEGMLPQEDSVNVCQLHAEMDLWATRYKLAKEAHKLARDLSEEIEKWDYCVSRLSEVNARAIRWYNAVEKIKSKYEKAKTAYENYFTELKVK